MADMHSSYACAPSPSSMDGDVEAALNKMQHLCLNLEENTRRDSPERPSRRISNTPGSAVGGRKNDPRDPRSNPRGSIESNAEVLYYLHHLQAKMQRGDNGCPPGNGYSNPTPYSWEDLEFLERGGGLGSSQQQPPGLLARDYSPCPQEPPPYRPANFDTYSPRAQSRQSVHPHSSRSYDQHMPYVSSFERSQSHVNPSYIDRRFSLPSTRSPPPDLDRSLRHRLSLDEGMLSSHSLAQVGPRERGMLDTSPEETWVPPGRRWTGGQVDRWSPPCTPHADVYDALAAEEFESHLPPGSLRGPSASQSPRSIVEAYFRESRSVPELWRLDSNQMMPPGKAFPSGCGLQSRKLPPLDIPSHAAEEWASGYLNGDPEVDGTLSPTATSPNPAADSQGIRNLYKTELCRSWVETGNCRYGGKCQFGHGQGDLRPVARHPKYKTEVCRTFNINGTCPYGTRCRFIHRSPSCPGDSPPTKSADNMLTSPDVEPALDSDTDNASRSRLRIFRDIFPADLQNAGDLTA